ncbi:NAD(P)/FAD-dependent oxidoreductase [Streptomyces californicus]
MSGRVASAERLPGAEDAGFRVVTEDGRSVEARRLLVTTGLVDELPPVPGLAERWGREVLHCPYCHGHEVADRPIGVLATGPLAVHQALMWRQWSDDVTLFLHTGPEPSAEEYEELATSDVAVVDGEVAGLEIADDRFTGVRLTSGRVVPREALVVQARFTARSAVLESLGLTPVAQEMAGTVVGTYIPSDPTGATEVPGVWAAGNVTRLTEQVVGAAAAGLMAAGALNGDLITEDTRLAVAARRA